MKKLIHLLFTSAIVLSLTGCFLVSYTVNIAGCDISPWFACDSGYAQFSTLDKGMTPLITNGNCDIESVTDFLRKIEFCDTNQKVVWQSSDFENQEQIYYVGLIADENSPPEVVTFYLLLFDDFSKAISIFDGELNEYYYHVENPDIVKQFFSDNIV